MHLFRQPRTTHPPINFVFYSSSCPSAYSFIHYQVNKSNTKQMKWMNKPMNESLACICAHNMKDERGNRQEHNIATWLTVRGEMDESPKGPVCDSAWAPTLKQEPRGVEVMSESHVGSPISGTHGEASMVLGWLSHGDAAEKERQPLLWPPPPPPLKNQS